MADSSPQKILVTGAAGFIGSRVCALLAQDGRDVVGLDNFNDAYDRRLKDWRWAQLEKTKSVELVRGDITDATSLKPLFEKHAFGAIINLAARAGVRASVENPSVYVEANVTGSLNLLELAKKFGVKKVVLASSSSLYGAGHPTPYREDLNTDHPLSPYAATKKAAEALAYSYHYLHKLDISTLRYFTVYGPAGRPDMAPLRFVQRIREGRPITVFGDGSQSRDFTYVDDIARGTIASLKPIGHEVFNLGSDEPLKLSVLIGLVEKLTGREAVRIQKPGHPADVPATWADISKARRVLGWEPKTHFEEGMRQLVEWYEANREWAKDIDTD